MVAFTSIFFTVQGEGVRAGEPSVFVRFAGCNLWSGRPEDRNWGAGACARWCDTDFLVREHLAEIDLVQRMNVAWRGAGRKACVLTGGEPFLQVTQSLADLLRSEGWFVAAETNGTRATRVALDWICCSPKRGSLIMIDHCDELKVVLPGDDGEGWTLAELTAIGERFPRAVKFVQPQDPIDPAFVEVSALRGSRSNQHYAANVERCMTAVESLPGWRVGVQGHKLLGLP